MKKYKNYIISFVVILAFCVSICFIPIDATRFIPSIESQVSKDLGIKIHIEKLILRLGPQLKVKAPVMHMMYEDGQKFGQFDNVKIFIPWSSLFKNDVVVKRLYANKLIIKVSSNDKYLNDVMNKMQAKDFVEIPDMTLKSYSISYHDVKNDKVYKTTGNTLELSKVISFENLRVKTLGEFFINDKKYLSYDVSILPNVKMPENYENINIESFIKQIEDLDFHSDIIADLKLYNNINGDIQISGLVNIDNISVLDTTSKMPKSFIYLTFLGDKVGVLSNIYASVDKKVYVDGVINNSKKKSVDLKVKTDEIKLDDLYQKIKLFADLSKFKSIESVNGILKADFSIKGDINKIKSSGFLKISDASVKANGIDVKNISSDIDFSNNIINITNAVGYVNNAPIMVKGKINKNIDIEVLMNKVNLKHLCSDKLGIKSGIVSLVANITGTLDNISHKENLQIENLKIVNKDYDLGFSNLKIDTNKDDVAYINNILINSKYVHSVKIPLLKLRIDRETIKISDTNIFMPNSKMTAKAEITNYNTKDLTYNVNLSGFVNSRDIKNIKSNFAIYPVKFASFGNLVSQNINSQIVMDKALILDEPAIINLNSKLENNNLKIEDLSVSSFSGKLSNDFKQNLKGQKKLIISGNIDNLLSPEFKNLRVFIPQQLNITYLDTIAQLKGDLFINGSVKKPEIVGQINAQNVINQFLQLAVGNLTIDFNKTVAVVNAPQVKIGDSSLGITSLISTDFSKELLIKTLNIKSKYINTDTFLMYKDSPVFKMLPVNIVDGKFFSEKLITNLYGSSLFMTAVSAGFDMKNEVINLKNISSELYNGKLAGSLKFNMKDECYETNLQARGVSAAPIFDVISVRKDSVSGTMDFDTNVKGCLCSKQSLNGNVKFVVHNGRMGTFGKLEHLLYAQNVIADNMLRTSLSVVTKAITLKDTGLFKYLRGDITLKGGMAHVNMLQSQGPLMSLFVKGIYNPENDYAKLVVLGRLSDEVISGLGAFGDFSFNKLMVMLTGEDNKYNVMPQDIENLPQLPMKNTKEFRSVINGIIDKPSSVQLFNWISYTQKSYRQKDVPSDNTKVPEFIEALPY